MNNLPNDFPNDFDDIDLWDIDFDLDFSSFGCPPNLSIDFTFYKAIFKVQDTNTQEILITQGISEILITKEIPLCKK